MIDLFTCILKMNPTFLSNLYYRFGSSLQKSAFVCGRFATVKYSTTNSKPIRQEKWDLMSAVSLERKPILEREFTELEKSVVEFLKKTEFEMSSKSDHEIRLITDKIKIEQLKKGDKNIEIDTITQQIGQDFEDECQRELEAFSYQERITADDKANNTKSTYRLLDRNLLLIVQENIGNDRLWVLPQGIRKEGETLRATAERVLKEKCGSDIEALFYGNAPVGFYKYSYPKNLRKTEDDPIGAKIFFFKAKLLKGNVNPYSKDMDYRWSTRKELGVLQKDYLKRVSMFLIDEEH
ncbi:39S ribosomal protein L46, mitochondrial [Nilaparvata lugens]|uniref:39S ribosomal protein L46, mitochondrial n=1 Tax=Nilaparvata lugens TaxID=108931 RepID=UPI000B99690F|nr:39S ribosomal protein L46, mitochondrial [Nilaparvata lugens]